MTENSAFAFCTLSPHSGELNEHSFLKPAGYHELICAIGEAASTHNGQALCDTLRRGYAWAFASLSIDVLNPVRDCSPLTARTWLSPARSPFYRREIEVKSESGVVMLHGTIFLVPLGLEDHRIVFDRDRLDYSPEILPEQVIADARSRMNEPAGFIPVETRTVRASDIDALGHMNNCRYAAFMYDALSAAQRSRFERPFRYSIDFRRQLEPDSTVSIELLDGETVYVRGVRPDNGKVSFVCSIS